MNLIATVIDAVERAPLPDRLTLAGIDWLCGRTARRIETIDDEAEQEFADGMDEFPIARSAEAANAPHYDLPPEYFGLVLGPARKYSCCLYPKTDTTLAEAEQLALHDTCEHAELEDGQRILELGCGWGALSLHMASRLPHASIVSVSNSRSQRDFIAAAADRRGLANLERRHRRLERIQPGAAGFRPHRLDRDV